MEIGELSERVEDVCRMYAAHHGFDLDDDWFMLKLQEEVGELTQAYMWRRGSGRTGGRSAEEVARAYESEVADVVAMVLLLARHTGVDVMEALERKWLSLRETTGG